VERLNDFSGGALTHPGDVALLLDLARTQGKKATFERLAFLSKFASRARGIMQRIGRDGEGYDALARELSTSLTEITGLVRELLKGATDEERERFVAEYLPMTPGGVANIFVLLADLSWYKNWKIDHPDQPV
jgi:hypothetical protein